MTRSLCATLCMTVSILFMVGSSHAEDGKSTEFEKMAVTDAQTVAAASSDAIIIDVRTPTEYEMSHIPDAINVSVQADSFEQMLAKLDTAGTYIVHCTKNPADGRSSRALQKMQELGFTTLYSLEGGYIAWQEAELPLVEAEN